MLNKALLMASGKKGPIRYFEFVASQSGSGVDFFGGSAPSSWVVSVNGAPTSQSASALTFSSGDTVRIEYDETPAALFSAGNNNYFKTIDGAIPVVESTNFSKCFRYCEALTVHVRISSAKVSSASYFANKTKAKGTVYVPSGSTTASTFKSTTDANVTVVEE